MKTAEELVAFGQGNFEAIVKSGQIWASGVQDIGKQMAANAQASFDDTMSTFKAISSVKSLKDAFDLQASLARSTMEKTLTEFGQADGCFDETHGADAGAAYRPVQRGHGEVRQGRLTPNKGLLASRKKRPFDTREGSGVVGAFFVQ